MKETIEAAAEFYDRTDTTTLPGEEVVVEPARAPMVSRSVRFDLATMRRLRNAADRHGAGVTQLMRQWVEECLAYDETAARGSEWHRTINEVMRMMPRWLEEAHQRAVTGSIPAPASGWSLAARWREPS